jgi:kinesin family protein 11
MGGVKIDVFVRIRPQSEAEIADVKGNAVVVVPGETKGDLKIDVGDSHRDEAFQFDQVMGQDCGQQEVFNRVVEPIIDQVATGMSCCLYAYGQTGAGKSHTMRGDLGAGDSPQQHGVIQRSVSILLERLKSNPSYSDLTIHVSFLEVYNEKLEDLLVKTKRAPVTNTSTPSTASKLMIIDDGERGSICHGLTEVQIEDTESVMGLLREGEQVARIAATKMNKNSNRAHRIFTIIVKYKRFDVIVPATLTFVDLAGSEDIGKSEATGATAKEAGHINKSLLSLGRVITALATNKKHIPYRDSKLTQLMSESLGGLCKTSFIVCVSPSESSITETNKTLRFAERAMQALNISQMPQWKQDQIMIDGLTRKVGQLHTQLERQAEAHAVENKAVREENVYLKACIEGIMARMGNMNAEVESRLTIGQTKAADRTDAIFASLQEAVSASAAAQEIIRAENAVAGQTLASTMANAAQSFHMNMAVTLAENEASHQNAAAKITSFQEQIGGCQQDLSIGTNAVINLTQAKHEQTVLGCAESQKFVEWTGEQFAGFTNEEADLAAQASLLQTGIQTHGDMVQSNVVSLAATQSNANAALTTGIVDINTVLTAADQEAAVFVSKHFQRDTQDPPGRKEYGFPQTFEKTPAYTTILSETPSAWSREARIEAGAAEPGQGIDYPGEMGAEDRSGVLEESGDVERHAADHSDAMEDAARDSDEEEYQGEAEELMEPTSPKRRSSSAPPGKQKRNSSPPKTKAGDAARPLRRAVGGANLANTATAASASSSSSSASRFVAPPAGGAARVISRTATFPAGSGFPSANGTASPRRPVRQSRP